MYFQIVKYTKYVFFVYIIVKIRIHVKDHVCLQVKVG